MIKAIVYDLDGMVFHAPHYFTEELEKKYGIPITESLFSKDFNYIACNEGKMTLDEFLAPYYERWRQHEKFNLSFEEAKQEWFDFSKIDPKMINFTKKLKKQGIVNVIATNNTRERIAYLREKYDLDETFEVIGSFDLGVMKPAKEYFLKVMDKLKLKPEEVLYYDDKESTIAKLKEFGFDAVVYRDMDGFKKDLEERKNKIK
jgi:HAD superfamily hydrolase (TIGR01509 family)